MATQSDKKTAEASGTSDKAPATTTAQPIQEQDQVVATEAFNTEAGRKAQIERELAEQKKLSEANEEGHAKIQKAIEEAHKDNKAAELTEGDERKIPEHPTSGLEHNRNTPRVDKDGNKHWD